MEAAFSAWLQPFLLALIAAISGFSAWQIKRWMEKVDTEIGRFGAHIHDLETFAATSREEMDRKTAALARVFSQIDDCGGKIRALAEDCLRLGQRLALMETRLDYLEKDRE